MKNTVIFGTGRAGTKAFGDLWQDSGRKIVAFADNDPRRQQVTLFGRQIVCPEKIAELKCDEIRIASMYAAEIRQQLLKLGHRSERIIDHPLPHQTLCLDEIEITEYEVGRLGANAKGFPEKFHSLNAQEELEAIRRDGFRWLIEANASTAARYDFAVAPVQGRISVVVPAFRATAFLEEAAESVFRQTYPNWELLIVEDGSNDKTWELAKTIAARIPDQCRVLRHKDGINRGVCASRNLGIANASGEYIALLDADDRYHPDRLRRAIDHFQEYPSALAVCGFAQYVNETGKKVIGYNGQTHVGAPEQGEANLYSFDALWHSNRIVNSTLTFRRQVLDEVGGYPEVMAYQAEDWLLNLKIARESAISLIPILVADYRIHPDCYTHTHDIFERSTGARMEVLYHLVHWMLQHPRHQEFGRQFYRREFPLLLATQAPMIRVFEEQSRSMKEGKSPEDFAFYLDFIQRERVALLELLERLEKPSAQIDSSTK